jgi:hypothetical protein
MNYCSINYPGDAHCFDGSSSVAVIDSIQYAIDYIRNNPGTNPTDGKIYVEKDTYFQDIYIQAWTYPVLSTLKGIVGLATGGVFPTINGNVTVTHTVSGFTLQGFTIIGNVFFNDNTGALLLQDLDVSSTSSDGIFVDEQIGNITMKNVNRPK